MNIFILDEDMEKSIQYLPDKHVVKMPLESTQLLCSTFNAYGIEVEGLYKPTHLKHPCSVWAAESLDNWLWLRDYTLMLGAEYTRRYGKDHKSVILTRTLPIPNIPNKGLTPFAKVVPDDFKELDTVTAYREYFKRDKGNIKEYTTRNIPEWWKE